MAVGSAVLLPSRDKETSHRLCRYAEKRGTCGVDAALKPLVTVTPPGS